MWCPNARTRFCMELDCLDCQLYLDTLRSAIAMIKKAPVKPGTPSRTTATTGSSLSGETKELPRP